MRIGCPGCDAAYEVPDAQIRPGRPVRCVRCAVQWQPAGELPEPEPEPEPGPELESEPESEPAALEQPACPELTLRHHSPAPIAVASTIPAAPADDGATRWRVAWAASVCLVAAAGFAFAHFRGTIIHGWPATIRLYALFGPS